MESAFCSNCGYLFRPEDMPKPQENKKPAAKSSGAEERKPEVHKPAAQTPTEKSGNDGFVLKLAIVGIIVVLLIVVGYMIAKNLDTSSSEDMYYDDTYSDDTYDETYSDDNTYQQDEDSYYVEGGIYYVQDVIKVREGPGKNYRQLQRSELTSEDYAISEDYPDALLKKGSQVTCLGMSGDWMMISSGWICVYDEGEYLVK